MQPFTYLGAVFRSVFRRRKSPPSIKQYKFPDGDKSEDFTWDDLLVKWEDYLDRDVLSCEDEAFCRGPLMYMAGKGRTLVIRLKWLAYSRHGKVWFLRNRPRFFSVDMKLCSIVKYKDMVIFHVPYLGTISILPEGDHLTPDDCILLDDVV